MAVGQAANLVISVSQFLHARLNRIAVTTDLRAICFYAIFWGGGGGGLFCFFVNCKTEDFFVVVIIIFCLLGEITDRESVLLRKL